MDFQAALGLTEPDAIDSPTEALDIFREEYGTRAVGFLVSLGIPRRTAQYYYAGRSIRQPERRALLVDYARDIQRQHIEGDRRKVADKIRRASSTYCPRVEVTSASSGDDEGGRSPGWQPLYALDRAGIAELVQTGEFEPADTMYSDAIMEAYGAGGALDIASYDGPIQWR